MKRLSVPVLHGWIFCPLHSALIFFGVLLWAQFKLPRQYSALGGIPAIFIAQGIAFFIARRLGQSLKEEHIEVVKRTATDIAIQRPFLLKGVYAKINQQGIQGIQGIQCDHLVCWKEVAACRIIKGQNDFGRDSSRVEVLGRDGKILLKIPLFGTRDQDAAAFIGVIKAALTNSVTQS
jgi:hypothetical protein